MWRTHEGCHPFIRRADRGHRRVQYQSYGPGGANVTRPVVSCTATWSSDSMTLTLTPMAPLVHGTMYSLHVGGGMRDADGQIIDMSQYGPMMGGDWADGGMMTGGGMMNPSHDEMGPGWQ